MKTATSKTTTKGIRYLWLPFLILAAMSLAGCGGLEEDVITREEIAAAKEIKVTFRSTDPRLAFRSVRHYIREGRLCIEGRIMNSSPRDIHEVMLRVIPFDDKGGVLAGNIVVYPVPRSLPPGVVAHFSVKLDPSGITAVAIEAET